MQSKDFFSQIREFQHTLAIFLTFTLENEVVQKIRESSTGRTIIIHDSEQGVSLEENYESRLICVPAIMKNRAANCFHPKLVILKGEDRLRILIGSMNLTRSSFSNRQELCFQKDIYPGTMIYDQIIQFLSIISYPKSFDLKFINELILKQENLSLSDNEEIKFIYNDENFSIYDKFIQEIGKLPTNAILKIASPFLSKDLPLKFDEFIDKLKPKKIELYTRSSQQIPQKIKELDKIIKLFEPDRKYSKYGFHAKIILIEFKEGMILYVGSANFTKQGFFSSLKEFGNQECGVILEVNDPIEIAQINNWFNKGWMPPCSPDQWSVRNEIENEFDDYPKEPYAFAIREGKTISVEIFVPDYDNKLNVTINSKKYVSNKNPDGFYKLDLRNIDQKTENLTVKFKNYDPIKIKIFNPVEYEKWKSYDGDSLFGYIDSPIESVDINMLSRSVNELGIKVGNGSYTIIEPPKLEQFYQNVKREYESIIRKKILTKSHLSELEKVLDKQEGGTGVYAIMQFIKAFNYLEKKYHIKLNEFKDLCISRIKVCLSDLKENEIRFDKFLNKWIKQSAN